MNTGKNALKILIIAGPNGAGKTTFCRDFLPHEAECLTFINADLIAAGLSPFQPENESIKAGKLMLEAMEHHTEKKESFAFETTLSGISYVQKIIEWKKLGYKIKLFFLKLPNVEMAIARVAERVKQGGHNIPEDVIRRRYENGYKNFITVYKPIVDEWVLFDNSHQKPIMIDYGEHNEKST